ncbi:MAG: hypothetical protein D6E12_13045 [Desulfovibrio sp.]|nr:MAG: hypothetical protein D6E12_13045 [Desulfovibrio sp.]
MLVLVFGIGLLALGLSMSIGVWKHRHWVRLKGEVVAVDETEMDNYRAYVEAFADGEQVNFVVPYESKGDHKPGEQLKCMWDGSDPKTVTSDYRHHLCIGVAIASAAGLFLLYKYFFDPFLE